MSDPRVYPATNPAAERRAIAAYPGGAGDGALWFGVFGPPIAWSVDSLTCFAMHQDYCAALVGRTFRAWGGIAILLTGVGLLMLAISIVAGIVAWRASAVLGADTGQGDTDLDRRGFMARAGLITSALFTFGIVLRIIAVFFVSPSACGS